MNLKAVQIVNAKNQFRSIDCTNAFLAHLWIKVIFRFHETILSKRLTFYIRSENYQTTCEGEINNIHVNNTPKLFLLSLKFTKDCCTITQCFLKIFVVLNFTNYYIYFIKHHSPITKWLYFTYERKTERIFWSINFIALLLSQWSFCLKVFLYRC